MNIRDFLESKVERHPEKIYLYFEDQEWTYSEFNDRVNQYANAFLHLGVRKGDRVAIMLPNCPEFLLGWLGLNKIGAIIVPINTAFKVNETRYIVEHSEARGIVVCSETVHTAVSLDRKGLALRWIAMIEIGPGSNNIVSLPGLSNKSSKFLEAPPMQDEDIASIIYTSGTTGPPKGVLHSHLSYVLCGEAMTVRAGLSSNDRLMVILPFFHANAQFYSAMGSLAAEASIVVISRFSASEFWRQAKKYGITQFNFIGAIGRILAARPIEEFESNHTIRVANGGPVPFDVYKSFTETFRIPYVIDGYGLTECPCVCQNPIDGVKKPGSMGLPARHPDPSIKFTAMKIVNEKDTELGPGQVGELVLRSPVLMKGYFKDPLTTKNAMKGGWFHTGDFCYRDEDGYYFFVDRKKDIIRRKGENISSIEVENVINEHPKVKESAVLAIASSLTEDEIKAFIVCKKDEYVTPEELVEWCAERLADFKIPRFLEYRQWLPKTPSQRIEKYSLREENGDNVIDMTNYVREISRRKRR